MFFIFYRYPSGSAQEAWISLTLEGTPCNCQHVVVSSDCINCRLRWKWHDGRAISATPPHFADWSQGYPTVDDTCATLTPDGWRAYLCNVVKNFICERRKNFCVIN